MFNLRQIISFIFFVAVAVWVSSAKIRPGVATWQLDVLLVLFSMTISYDSRRKSTIVRIGRMVVYIVALYQFLFFACPVIRTFFANDYSSREFFALHVVAALFYSWWALLWLALSLVLLKSHPNRMTNAQNSLVRAEPLTDD
jgi:hypothetical protein